MRTAPALLAALLAVLIAAPVAAADSDGDLLSDWFEINRSLTDPNKKDSDGDGLVDSVEDHDRDGLGNLGEQKWGTDPRDRDSDDDGVPDKKEDADRNGRSNGREQDRRRIPAGLTPTLSEAKYDLSPHKEACQTVHKRTNVTLCDFGPADGSRTVALMGDSHALQILRPIKKVVKDKGWHLTTLFKKACPPILGVHNVVQNKIDGGRTCRKWRRKAHRWLRDNPPDYIIIAHSDQYDITTMRGKLIRGRKKVTTWREGMRATMKNLPTESHVLLMGGIPVNRSNPVKCLRRHRWNVSACVSPRVRKAKRKVEAGLRRATVNQGGSFRSVYSKVCTYDPCPIMHGDVLVWRDRGHYTHTFSRQLTPSFRQIIDGVFDGPQPTHR